MRRRLIAAVLAVTASAVTGCAAAQPPHPAVFDRPPNADHTLPADITGYGADTVRLVGDDVEGARYWVARLDDGLPCIIRDPAEGDWMGVCGASGLSGIAQDGTVVEFASDPRELSRETAELVGDTILVRHP